MESKSREEVNFAMGKALKRRVQRRTRSESNAAQGEIHPYPAVYALVKRRYGRPQYGCLWEIEKQSICIDRDIGGILELF